MNNVNIIDFSAYKVPRNSALKPTQPMLTSHEVNVKEEINFTEFEKSVDTMMSCWYNNDIKGTKDSLLEAYIELAKLI